MTTSRSTSPTGKPRRRAEQHAPVVRADDLVAAIRQQQEAAS